MQFVNESIVQQFWQRNPCGAYVYEGTRKFSKDEFSFFDRYDDRRYATESHILECLDDIDFAGKQTLEIGLGQGAEAEQIIRRGACWSGVELTQESVRRVRHRLALKNLPYRTLKQGSVTRLPFDDNSFDIVFSHGVLHHVPDIRQAEAEIWRVLKPSGRLIAMLYAKNSLNYWVSISVLRRIGLAAMYLMGLQAGGILGQHIHNANNIGLSEYLRMENFIHANTDGPLNPYSKVYDLKTVREDFRRFEIVHSSRHFMHAPPLPVKHLPLAGLLGWHLWVNLSPIKK